MVFNVYLLLLNKLSIASCPLLLLIICVRLCLVSGAREPPMVQVPSQGMLMGAYLRAFRTQVIVGYLGIPYAQPPIDLRRFQPPVVDNLPSWEGVRNATTLPAECLQNPLKPRRKHEEAFASLISKSYGLTTQPTPPPPMMMMPTTGGQDEPAVSRHFSEDCLFLNVYLPDGPPPMEGYAVIAWLHGGDFSSGSPSELDPFQLVLKQKVVVVTIAYRLNIFGFFTSVDGEAPGNFGLMDQSAALLWIKTNIKLFGGNPDTVTLMGQGSGGVSVGLHLTSGEWSDGMFHRAIIMSGNALYDAAVRSPQSYVSSVDMTATAFGCFRRPTAQLMTCLRNVPAQILSDSSPIMDWGPVMDDGMSNTTTPFIRQFPRLLAGSGMLKSIPLLIGHTNMEEVLDFVGEISEGMNTEMYDNVLNDMILNELALVQDNDTMCGNNQLVVEAVNFVYRPYPPTDNQSALRDKLVQYNTERKFAAPTILLANQMSKQSDVYMYRFDMKARTMAVLGGYPEWIGVPHKFDLVFVWGLPYWAVLPNNTQWDATDKRISEIIMTLFMNFAKYGNPTQTGVYIRWEKFTANDPGILIVDRAFNMSDRTNMNFAAYQFWNDFYPRVMSFAAACCNATDTGRPLVIAMSVVNHLLITPLVVGLTSAILLNQFSFV